MKNKLVKPIVTYGFLSLMGTSMASAQNKTNILLIMADDMGYECVGANGSTYQTPHLDKLAEEGILFQNCHSQPLSTPSRVQLMTGKYNFRNYSHFAYLNPKERTFAHMAKEMGYQTCIAGKWQLGFDERMPKVFGFDSYCLWQLTKQRGEGERYANVLYEKDGQVMPRDKDVYGPDVFVDYIDQFITKNKNQPFFVYYPMVLTHDPFYPTPDSEEWKDASAREQENTKYMADMVAYTDKLVGKLLKVLEREGVRDNTLVIFLGDNGTNVKIQTPMKDGSLIRGGKKGTKRYGTHVPMIVSWPEKIKQGRENPNLVDFSDFYITLRDVMGADPGHDRDLDGLSFYPQLLNEKSKVREWSLCHYQDQFKPDYVRFAQTVDYKLYLDGRFFNTRKDPLEEKNIQKGTGSAAEEALRKQLKDVLNQYPVWGEGVLTAVGNN